MTGQPIPPPPPPAPRSPGRRWLPVAIVAGILAALGVTLIVVEWLCWPGPRDLPPRPLEPAVEKYRAATQAFAAGRPSEIPPAELAALQRLFEELLAAVRAKDAEKVRGCFDAARMFEELKRLGTASDLPPERERDFIRGMRTGLGRMHEQPAYAHTRRFRIGSVQRLGADEAVVYWRGWLDTGASLKFRWWVRRSGETWRIYDMEDLDGGFRMSDTIAGLLRRGLGDADVWVRRAAKLRASMNAMMEGDIDLAEKHLAGLGRDKLPNRVEALRLLLLAWVAVRRERFPRALEFAERAEALNPDMPALLQLRATACNRLGRHPEALRSARKYVELLGDDAEGFFEIAFALEGLERAAEAAEAYAKALTDDPDLTGALIGLGRTLPDEAMSRLAERFGKTTDPKARFDEVAWALVDAGRPAAVRALINAYRTLAPKAPLADYYEGEALLLDKQPRRAAELAKAAAARTKDAHLRQSLLELHLRAAGQVLAPLEAYADAPDAGYAFEALCDGAVDNGDAELLRKLIAAHRARSPDDVLLHVYTGEAHLIDQEYEQADAAFARAMAAPASEANHEWFRRRRVYGRFLAGEGLGAYGTIGDRKRTFDQLAELFAFEAGDAEKLAALLAAHARVDPDDDDLHCWRAEVHWLHRQYDATVETLRGHRKAILRNEDNVLLFDDLMVRSLVRLKRFEEARSAARESTARDGDPYFEGVVAAAAGDEAAAAAILRRCLAGAGGYAVADFYEDEDLGPLLRSGKLPALGKEFPPPASRPAED